MPELILTQTEADALIQVEKHSAVSISYLYPFPGERLEIPLISIDRRTHFLLDIRQGRIKLTQSTHQTRAHVTIILVRLDIDGRPHRNPDHVEIPCPHLHLYRAGYADKWAIPAPLDKFPNLDDLWATLDDFMRFCNVTKMPNINKGIFT